LKRNNTFYAHKTENSSYRYVNFNPYLNVQEMQSIKTLLDVNRNVEEHDIDYLEAFDFHIDDDDEDCMQEDEF